MSTTPTTGRAIRRCNIEDKMRKNDRGRIDSVSSEETKSIYRKFHFDDRDEPLFSLVALIDVHVADVERGAT